MLHAIMLPFFKAFLFAYLPTAALKYIGEMLEELRSGQLLVGGNAPELSLASLEPFQKFVACTSMLARKAVGPDDDDGGEGLDQDSTDLLCELFGVDSRTGKVSKELLAHRSTAGGGNSGSSR